MNRKHIASKDWLIAHVKVETWHDVVKGRFTLHVNIRSMEWCKKDGEMIGQSGLRERGKKAWRPVYVTLWVKEIAVVLQH